MADIKQAAKWLQGGQGEKLVIQQDLREDYDSSYTEAHNPERPIAWVNAMETIVGYIERIARAEAENAALKAQLAEARKAAREETLAAVWTYCIDASVECNLECLIESVRNKLAASGNEQRHGECPACTMGQSLERGEGTHREGTRQHPISEKGEKE